MWWAVALAPASSAASGAPEWPSIVLGSPGLPASMRSTSGARGGQNVTAVSHSPAQETLAGPLFRWGLGPGCSASGAFF